MRRSDRYKAAYVLSYMGCGGGDAISHFIVTKTDDNRLSIGGILFNQLCDVVAYYSTPGAHLLKDQYLQHPVPLLDKKQMKRPKKICSNSFQS